MREEKRTHIIEQILLTQVIDFRRGLNTRGPATAHDKTQKTLAFFWSCRGQRGGLEVVFDWSEHTLHKHASYTPMIRFRMDCASLMVFSWKQCSNPGTPCVLDVDPTAMTSLS